MSLTCTHALVARPSGAWLARALRDGAAADEARREHAALERLLRELNVELIELGEDDLLQCSEKDSSGQDRRNESSNGKAAISREEAGSPFVEDGCVVANGTALLARGPRMNALKSILKKHFDLTVISITDEDARLDGGDVLFTGKEFFIGLSQASNEAGARAVADAFPEFPCTPIKVPNSKRLKGYVTMAGPDLLCVGAGKEAQGVLKRIEREASYTYQTLTVPEDAAANCLYVNGTLIHLGIEDIPDSFKVFCEKIDFARRSIRFAELSKISSGLTSSCLLVKRSKYFKNL